MARKKRPEDHVNLERWLISYADFITLMFAFFVVMFSVSQVDTEKLGKFSESFSEQLGVHIFSGSPGLFDGQPSPFVWTKKAGGKENKGGSLNQIQKQLRDQIKKKQREGMFEGEKSKQRNKAARPKEMADVGLRVLRRRQELVLRLDHDVLFTSGGDDLQPTAFGLLQLIADTIRGQDVDVRVEGHTDTVPIHTARFRSNWHLSTARATAVILFFAEKARIPPDRLAAAGYGEHQPVASNATVAGRSRNRRVDIVITQREPIEPLEKTDKSAKGSTAPKKARKTTDQPDRSGTGLAKDGDKSPGTQL